MADEIVFTFSSTHRALAGERALLAAGFAVRVMSRPALLGTGCGICLRVDAADGGGAGEILREAGAAAQAAFLKTRDGGGTLYKPL